MNSNNGVCEICGRKDGKLGVIWYGLDGYPLQTGKVVTKDAAD